METQASYLDIFSTAVLVVPDPRIKRTQIYPLSMLLFCAICTFIVGGASFHAMEVFADAHKNVLTKLFGVDTTPSHDTFNRLFCRLDTKALGQFLMEIARNLGGMEDNNSLAIDGKTCRRARSAITKAAHVLGAWSPGKKFTLGVVAIDDKTNEIPAAQELLKLLGEAVKGCVVTADAMHTQLETAELIINLGGDYILPVKGNQQTLQADVVSYLDSIADSTPPGFTCTDKGHGRIDTRKTWQVDNVNWLSGRERGDWAGLQSLGVVERTYTDLQTQKETTNRRYFISSLPVDPERFATFVRNHWDIENACHWSLDVVYDEDQSRARTKNAAANLRTIRSVAMNILSACKQRFCPKFTMKKLGFKMGLSPAYLYEVLGINLGEI